MGLRWLLTALIICLSWTGQANAQDYDNRLDGTPAEADDWGRQPMPE